MKYKIICDKPHRLRLRFGKYIFTKEQCYGLSDMLLSLYGVTSATANSTNGSVLIEYNEKATKKQVLDFMDNLSLADVLDGEPTEEQKTILLENEFKKKVVLYLVKHTVRHFLLPSLPHKIYTCYRAIPFIKMGIIALANKKTNVEVLDATAIFAALITKQYKTASSTMFLLRLSDLLLEYSNMRAKNELAKSLKISVDKVWLVKDGVECEVPLESVQKNDVIRIRKGSLIPVDGNIVNGEALVNESTMTGEPLAVHKSTDGTVFAGTVIEDGEIDVEVLSTQNNSRIAKILELIDTGEKEKASIQSDAERLADNIVPVSFGLSLLTLLLTRNVMRALSVLMVDFSCAIKLTTPITIISALKESVNKDALIKGGKYLEVLSKVDTVVFDKTGTLTNAVPTVSKVIQIHKDYDEYGILKIAACLEEHFPHSVASSIVATAQEKNIEHPEDHGKVEYIVAHGIASSYNGKKTIIGSRHFIFEDEKIPYPEDMEELLKNTIGSDSAVYLAVDGELVGIICITDSPRDDAKQTIELLKQDGIKEIIMITGDSEGNAKHTCELLGITKYYAEILPDGKASIIESLKAEGKTILMIGDGINDTPALSVADVSLTMNGSSDIAREVADISVTSNDLTKIVTIRRLSIGLIKKIQKQYRFILAFNSTLIALGLFGVFSASTSALLHNASTICLSALSTKSILNKKDLPELMESNTNETT